MTAANADINNASGIKAKLPAPLRTKPATITPVFGDGNSSKTAVTDAAIESAIEGDSDGNADAARPFAAAPSTDGTDIDVDDGDIASPLAASASPFAAPTAAGAAGDSLAGAPVKGSIAAALDAPGLPSSTTDTDPWATPPRTGLLAKLLSSPKRLAIAGGAAVVLIAILIMAMSGDDKKAAKASAAPDKDAETKRPVDEDLQPTAVERGSAEAAGSGEEPAPVESDPAAAGSDSVDPTADPVEPAPVKTPVKKTPVKRVTTKTPVKKTAKKTAKTKAPATTKAKKPGVQPAKKCDPNALFPCKTKK